MGAEFPELTLRRDYILSAILERLGRMLAHWKIPDPVSDVTPLTLDYLDELYEFAVAKAQDLKEAADTGGRES